MEFLKDILEIIVALLTITNLISGFFLKKAHDEIQQLKINLKQDSHDYLKQTVKANRGSVANNGDHVNIINQGSEHDA